MPAEVRDQGSAALPTANRQGAGAGEPSSDARAPDAQGLEFVTACAATSPPSPFTLAPGSSEALHVPCSLLARVKAPRYARDLSGVQDVAAPSPFMLAPGSSEDAPLLPNNWNLLSPDVETPSPVLLEPGSSVNTPLLPCSRDMPSTPPNVAACKKDSDALEPGPPVAEQVGRSSLDRSHTASTHF